MLVLPALAALPAVSVKFTALAERVSVSDSARVAFRVIGCAPELSTCADAIETANVIASVTTATRKNVPVLIFPPECELLFRLSAAVRAGGIIRKLLSPANGTL